MEYSENPDSRTLIGLIIVTVLLVVIIFWTDEAGSQELDICSGPTEIVTDIYQGVLDRNPDSGGLEFWVSEFNDEGPRRVVDGILGSQESHRQNLTVVDLYERVLDRAPDRQGLIHWRSKTLNQAVLGIVLSSENLGCEYSHPVQAHVNSDWVDTGNGVMVPKVLLQIRFCESRDDYLAANSASSARGAYQFLIGSWGWYGHAERYGVPEAHLATPAQQDEAALLTWQQDGTRPWNASRHCWRS